MGAAAPSQLLTSAVAHDKPRAEHLHALLVRLARPATPFQADPVAPVVRAQTVGQRPAIFTALAIPFGTRRDRSAASSITKPVAALAVRRAVALRHVPRPGPRPRPLLMTGRTIVCDHLVEWSERPLLHRTALPWRILGAGSRRCRRWHGRCGVPQVSTLVARPTGDRADNACPGDERDDGVCRTHPALLPLHGDGHVQPRSASPCPPRKKMSLFRFERV
jgi:hypothetical protein